MYLHVVFYILPIFLTIATIVYSFILFTKLFHDNNKANHLNPVEESALKYALSAADSASAAGGRKYEVFLSFRGKDTRTGFTDYLYTYLVGAGIRTFRDDNELQIGEEINPDLRKAISESKICIPIFSKNYVASKWCMFELAKMVECHQSQRKMIIPIFYDMLPSDVRNRKGSYEKAFQEHENKFDKKTVEGWKDALAIVGKLKGLELRKATNGLEGALVKMVVEEVMLLLKKNYTRVPENLVGMGHHVDELERLLCLNHNSVKVVGIHGMGGIGKTTISKVVYNRLCDLFEYSCFLSDVRERSRHQNGIVDLQSEFVSKITKQRLLKFNNIGEGIDEIKDVVTEKKILIVLDDIDEMSQFDQLIGKCNWFGDGSRIMITTRNKDVLDTIEATCRREGLIEAYNSYEPQLMDDDNSLILFCNYAFQQKSPPQEFKKLSGDFVSSASGLPLVLVTIGSLLFGKEDSTLWEDILWKLQRVPHKDVSQKLRISFDALEYEQQQIFLDIACLFIGKDMTNPIYMWDACGFYPISGINTLVLRSLVRVRKNNKLKMHDQLRDLGRQIIREENMKGAGQHSRVWDREEAQDVLQRGLGKRNLEVLNVNLRAIRPEGKVNKKIGLYTARKNFSQLRNLRFLRLGSGKLSGDFENVFSKLIWLQWRSHESSIPFNLNLENLIILELSTNTFTSKCDGWKIFKDAKRLKVLKLEDCKFMRELDCSTFEDLEILILKGCNSLVDVKDISNLKMLKEVRICDCSSLTKIQGIENMEFLEILILERCQSMEKLPNLSKLKMLKKLHLKDMSKLRKVGNLGGLESLDILCVKQCKSLERLYGLSSLGNLKKLHVCMCMKLTDIQGLEGLVSLEILKLCSCNLLSKVLNFSNLKNLKKLDASWMECLTEIRGFAELRFLKVFTIEGCTSLTKLPDFSNLKSLKKLVARHCKKLTEISGLDGLVSLECLDLYDCRSLGRMLDLSSCRNLKKLMAGYSVNLTEIKGIEEIRSLETLSIENCSSLEKLSDLSNLTSLKTLNIEGCHKLPEIEDLSGLISLVYLHLCDCKSQRKTLDLSCLKYLKELGVEDSKHLKEIKGLEELKSLEALLLRNCILFEKIPDLSNLTNLKILHAQGCEKLVEICGLEELRKRCSINITND